jgi:hypothetical protein
LRSQMPSRTTLWGMMWLETPLWGNGAGHSLKSSEGESCLQQRRNCARHSLASLTFNSSLTTSFDHEFGSTVKVGQLVIGHCFRRLSVSEKDRCIPNATPSDGQGSSS